MNEATTPEARNGSSRSRRKWTWFLAVISVTTLLAIMFNPGLPRRLSLVALSFYYTHIDSFQVEQPNLGPPPVNESANERTHRKIGALGFAVSMDGPRAGQWETPFIHERADASETKEFAAEVNSLIDSGGTPFTWSNEIRSLTQHGKASLPDNAGLDQFLKHATENKTLTCYYFSHLLQGACVGNGYTSRVLGLSSDGRSFDHAVTEVYLPTEEKWVLIDCDFNVAYKAKGQWLNAFEIREYWLDFKKWKRSQSSPGNPQQELERLGLKIVALGEAGRTLRMTNMSSKGTGMNLRLFEWIFYDTRNNFISAKYPTAHPDAVRQFVIGPKNRVPTIAAEALTPRKASLLYPHVGATSIQFEADIVDNALKLKLGTITPGFAFFEYRIEDGDWQRIDGDLLHAPLAVQTTKIRAVNANMLRGPVRTIRISAAN